MFESNVFDFMNDDNDELQDGEQQLDRFLELEQ
jgi:hypothetical protein